MNTKIILVASLIAVFTIGLYAESAEANPAAGSGTPYISADGVVGAAIIAGAVFGGIAGAFFIKGRSGKYAAMGRG